MQICSSIKRYVQKHILLFERLRGAYTMQEMFCGEVDLEFAQGIAIDWACMSMDR